MGGAQIGAGIIAVASIHTSAVPGGTTPLGHAPVVERRAPFVAWWAAFNLAVGSFPLGNDIYLSQILLVALCGAVILLERGDRATKRLVGVLLVSLAIGAWTALAGAFDNPYFISETMKSLLLLASAIVLWGTVGWRDLAMIARISPLVVCVVLLTVLALGLGNYYGEEGRFGVPWWGSPNSTAFVVAITVALQLYDIRRRWEALGPTANRPIRCLPQFILLLILCAFVIFTGSSGGLLSLAIILLRFVGVRLRFIFGGLLTVVIGVLVVGVELPELIGSGRPLIWQDLIEEFYHGGWGVWIVGFGPGAIDLTPWFTESVRSAHSMYIEVGYGFGLTGLIAMIVALVSYARVLAKAPLERTQRALLEAAFGALVAGFVVDTYLMTAQLTWFGALILACGALATRQTPE